MNRYMTFFKRRLVFYLLVMFLYSCTPIPRLPMHFMGDIRHRVQAGETLSDIASMHYPSSEKTVKEGETLSDIALENWTKEIAKQNNLQPPYDLTPGQTLVIPPYKHLN